MKKKLEKRYAQKTSQLFLLLGIIFALPTYAADALEEKLLTVIPASDFTVKNRAPVYPHWAKRLGQQGRVVIRIFIEPTGMGRSGEVFTSSGFPMLDQEALDVVSSWAFVPGKRNGVPEGMWFNVPIVFKLE